MRKWRMLAMTAAAMLAIGSPWAAAQDAPPEPVPDTQPVDPPAPMPDPEPETPAEIAVGQQALAAFQLVLDTLGQHDRGAADLAEAESGVAAAEGTLARAEQHLDDVTSERTGSAMQLVGHARAAISVLEQLVLEYSPASP